MPDSVSILVGDCIEKMRSLPDGSVNCCVTSPAYFNLRDYGCAGQLGQERTPDEYINNLVAVFREVKRVLRHDGTLWLNIGDSYAGGKTGRTDTSPEARQASLNRHGHGGIGVKKPDITRPRKTNGMHGKQLLGIPWRVALALQADGWFLRQDIIWHKKNCMPESVTDRCTKTHEYIFLLSKSPTYYYDYESIKEPAKDWGTRERKSGSAFVDGVLGRTKQSGGKNCNFAETGKNKRSVWLVAPSRYSGAHFATFPKELIRPCIKAGCPMGGVVLDPFAGSGTTAEVAIEEGRRAILCELNPTYVALIEKRLSNVQVSLPF